MQQQEQRSAREYETIYILQPLVDHDEAEKVANRISEVVQRMRGKLTKVDNWGRRRLAYPIAKSSRGIFVYLRYLGFNDLVPELERNLRMFDSVLRYQTVLLSTDSQIDQVTVDPEAVKFRALETTEEEEEELGLEHRLGMVQQPRKAVAAEDEFAEEEEAGLGEEEDVEAPSEEPTE